MADRISKLKYEKPIRVQAFDPGGTTGFIELLVSFDEPVKILRHDEFKTFTKVNEYMEKSNDTNLIVIYETFHILTMYANPIPLEVIGVIKYLSILKGITLYPQTPDTRHFAGKRYPRETRNIKSHTESALLHSMTYCYFKLGINKFPEFII